MVRSLAGKHRKSIAAFMATIFVVQGLTPLIADAGQRTLSSSYAGCENSYSSRHLNTSAIENSFVTDSSNHVPVVASALSFAKPVPITQRLKTPNKKFVKPDLGGPGQPEMSSFQSVNSNNMVDLFTGDFSYNVPLMDVGGYPINLHYNSGVTMDQEASWVGLGFNINPGTITRNMRGIPDDFNGTDSITKIQSIKVNKTVGVKLGAQGEFVGLPLSVGAGFGVFHNNYNGWGVEQSLNAAISLTLKSQGTLNGGDSSSTSLSLGLGLNNNSQTGLTASPSLDVKLQKFTSKDNATSSNFGISTNYNTRAGLTSLTIGAPPAKLFNLTQKSSNSVNISFAQPSVTPTISMPTTSENFVFHVKTGTAIYGFHGNVYVEGYVNKQEIKKEDQVQKLPAYGYLYYTNAATNKLALLDYNREKDMQYNYSSTPNIAIPQYTYDIYSISGEGTGGTIRPYRGDVGNVNDHYMRTKSADDQFSAELGLGHLFHLGWSYDFVRSYTENSTWKQQNNMKDKLAFQTSDSLYQPVYFRNPSEKSSNTNSYYQQIGNDDLMRVKLDRSSLAHVSATNTFIKYVNGAVSGTLPVNDVVKKSDRDKRSQVVTYLTASDASVYGLDKNIYSYAENTIPLGICQDAIETIQRVDNVNHKKNHISEIDVLNADGRKYVYGIPAYNVQQKDVTFSVDKESDGDNVDSGLVVYDSSIDNSVHNNKGKENYYNQESIPAYAHSFLLTGILSSDYVDLKDDGITEDDLGDAVKFNYTRVYGPAQGYFNWRTPSALNKANYNEGFKTYSRDDKGSYLYGMKEVWYTHSIESKTMIALFKLSSDRADAYSVNDENGGFNTNKALRKLDRIELYAKADLIKNGANAKPIKTVHFEYSYDLCARVYRKSAIGKLTLKKIWFSYNGNEKGKQNPYVFNYSSFNPGYHPKKYDRWGNYKDQTLNANGLSNSDFPYAEQDSAVAAQNASAWNLTDIQLPSGGKMKVTYESDDYGYVQNKRAEQMFTVAGFGSSPTDRPSNNLYGLTGSLYNVSDYDYVFVSSAIPINDAKDVFQKYLAGNEWIYMKIAVIMPTDRWGSGFDFVPVYGQLADYGKVSGQDMFWIRFQKVQGVSPILRSAFQFLKNNLPSKAYPTSELGDNVDLGAAVKMLLSSIKEVKNAVTGFENASMSKGWCQQADVTKSFIRLNSPLYKKLGGGLRVKTIQIFDNWKSMTNQQESVYGQSYDYRTSIIVNGEKQIISSGVATYEPMIGNEENPFRQPVNYSEKIAPLAPVEFLYSEMPLGESYFPGASVGYSKVRVRTINTKAKSANGWEETEFFTSKDFPTIVENTLLDQDAKTKYKPKLLNFFKIYSVSRTTVSQGFKIELNDMNGKVKRNASFAETDSLNPISYSLNFYKVDDSKGAVPKLNNNVWIVDSLNGKINQNGMIGKDIELMTDFRQQYSLSVSGGISPNLDFFMIGIFPVPLPSFFKFPQFDESLFRSAATVKVVQRYGILDSVVVMDKGSVVSTKNLLYDGETGEVLLSRTSNEFNDPLYNFSYPAYWAYSGMGMAYKNVDAIFKGLNAINGKLYYPGANLPFPTEKYFESGDELWLNGQTQVNKTGQYCLQFDPNFSLTSVPVSQKAWIIAASKGKEHGNGLYLIDKDGRAFNGTVSMIKILKSGKKNMLNASAGSILSMDNPITQIDKNNYKLSIDSSIRIINASVSTYSDFWKVDNTLYQVDSCFTTFVPQTAQIYPTVNQIKEFYISGGAGTIFNEFVTNSDLMFSGTQILGHNTYKHDKNSQVWNGKALLQFASPFPKGSIINDATLYLTQRAPVDIPPLWSGHYALDWNSQTSYFANVPAAHRSVLKRIATPWLPNGSYVDYVGVSKNSIELDQNSSTSVNIKNLMQDITDTVNFGILYQLKNEPALTSYEKNKKLLSYLDYSGNTPAPSILIHASVPIDTCAKVCRHNINDTMINPYKWGILGNWRMNRAYTYYNDRRETDASVSQTNIRSEGVLKNFIPFWNFTDSALIANIDTTRWVWNTAMSGYNKKGFETENYDPLGRYNSGLYGYKQTLPVAVTQNSRYREMLSDGFEDYSYKTKNCATCETPREFDFVGHQTGVSISDVDSHTGRYSLYINSNTQSRLAIPVINSAADSANALSMKVDSTPVYMINVIGKGTGLPGSYRSGTIVDGDCHGTAAITSRLDTTIDFSWGETFPLPGTCALGSIFTSFNYKVSWSGKVQAKFDGYYRFYLEYTGIGNVSVTRDTKTVSLTTTSTSGKFQTDTIYLKAGTLYPINVTYSSLKRLDAGSEIKLSWAEPQNLPEQIIPKNYLYPSDIAPSDTVGSIQKNVKFYCIKLNNIKPQNVIKPSFSPYQGSKMIVSGWVKMGGAGCDTAAALTNVIVASVQGNNATVALQKTGVRIEGWQRYESVITLPVNATQLYLTTTAPAGRSIYVDDIRIQPYNSNMKTYVYDPFRLRLMAELDENNYATFYEYDDDGTLIRVKKETEKGIQTIKETRSALIKIIDNGDTNETKPK